MLLTVGEFRLLIHAGWSALRSIHSPNPVPRIVDERWSGGAIDLGTGAMTG
jgi:hypothetical protein